MVKKQAGDMSPEKLRLGPGAKTRAFDVAPEMTISKGDVSRVNQKVKSPLKSPFRKKSNIINSISFNPAAKTGKLSFEEPSEATQDRGLKTMKTGLKQLLLHQDFKRTTR